jgi:hypothetical protein
MRNLAFSIAKAVWDITLHADVKLFTAENLSMAELLLLIAPTKRESPFSTL